MANVLRQVRALKDSPQRRLGYACFEQPRLRLMLYVVKGDPGQTLANDLRAAAAGDEISSQLRVRPWGSGSRATASPNSAVPSMPQGHSLTPATSRATGRRGSCAGSRIVPDSVERDHVGMVLQHLAACISKLGKPAHVHPHGEVDAARDTRDLFRATSPISPRGGDCAVATGRSGICGAMAR